MVKNIELEYRVLVPVEAASVTLSKLKQDYELISQTRRVSHMAFWKSEGRQFDVRVRITNGESEVVLKIGDLHSHERIELAQPIERSQIIGLTRIFSNIADQNYIAERETFNFRTESGVVLSFVKSGDVTYIEYEMLSDEQTAENNKNTILNLIKEHGFEPLDEAGFDELNKMLDDTDWSFEDKQESFEKLSTLLENY